ncbi:MFS transporter [Bacillus sonorensis]|nr:MFS transporter [Bacillus sonorensis]
MELQKQLVYEEKQILRKDHVIFWGAVFCFWFATYIYVPVFGLYLDSIGFSYSAIGIVLGSYGVTQILLRFPFGILSDVLSPLRKQLLISGFAMSLLSCFIFLLFDSFIMVITARLLAEYDCGDVGDGNRIILAVFHKRPIVKSDGHPAVFNGSPQFISMAVSGYLVHLFGWMFPFWIGVAVSCIGLVLSFYIKDNGPRHTAKGMALSDYVKQTVRLPDLKAITTLSFLAHAVLFMTVFGFTPIYAETVGIDEKQLLWVMCAFFVPQTLASVWCIFYKVKAADALIWISYVITAVFLCLLPFAESLFAVCLIHTVTGLTLGFIFPLLVSKVVQLGTPQLKMSVMGFYQSFYALGFFSARLRRERWLNNSGCGKYFGLRRLCH